MELPRRARAQERGLRTPLTIKRLIEAIEGGAPVEAIKDRLNDLQARKAVLEADLAQAKAPAPRLMPNLAEAYRAKVEKLHDVIGEPDSDGVTEAIRALVSEITLVPDEADRSAPLAVEVRGDLAAILALGTGSKAEAGLALAGQLKLVAGTGFEPVTFRL